MRDSSCQHSCLEQPLGPEEQLQGLPADGTHRREKGCVGTTADGSLWEMQQQQGRFRFILPPMRTQGTQPGVDRERTAVSMKKSGQSPCSSRTGGSAWTLADGAATGEGPGLCYCPHCGVARDLKLEFRKAGPCGSEFQVRREGSFGTHCFHNPNPWPPSPSSCGCAPPRGSSQRQ